MATELKVGDQVRYRGRKWFIDELPDGRGSLTLLNNGLDIIVAPIEMLKKVKS